MHIIFIFLFCGMSNAWGSAGAVSALEFDDDDDDAVVWLGSPSPKAPEGFWNAEEREWVNDGVENVQRKIHDLLLQGKSLRSMWPGRDSSHVVYMHDFFPLVRQKALQYQKLHCKGLLFEWHQSLTVDQWVYMFDQLSCYYTPHQAMNIGCQSYKNLL